VIMSRHPHSLRIVSLFLISLSSQGSVSAAE
jgi:hypothetical protein